MTNQTFFGHCIVYCCVIFSNYLYLVNAVYSPNMNLIKPCTGFVSDSFLTVLTVLKMHIVWDELGHASSSSSSIKTVKRHYPSC